MTLACHGFGFPAPIITWSDAWNQVMENGHILQLPKINRNMAGQYSCTASNSCGTDSRKVDIDVRCEFISAMNRILESHNLYVVSTNLSYIFINFFYLVLKRRNKFTMWHAFPHCVLHNTEFFPCRRFCCVLPVCALNEEDHCIIQQREEQRGGLLLVLIHVALS